ncbi:MAG TPA: EAL domain-containing protein, partial [Thermomicrobiales bacterium]|nr:EAL domain-containing protein [Thermomicrobiales bacterium]
PPAPIMGRVARTGVPALLEDVAADPEFIQARDDVVSEVCVPLTDRGRVVGVLNAESRGGVRLGGADLRLLTAIGHHTSIALERARLYAEARAGAERLAAAEAIAHLGSWEYDAVAGALRWSDEVYRIFGHAPWAFAPTLERYEAQIHPDDRALVRAAWAALREAGRPYALDHRIVRPDGAVRVCHQRAEARPGAAGRPARLVGAIQDVTERRALEAQLAHQANHDALTGLPNRALFLDRLAQALRHARRRPGYRFAVLYLDLDRFKTINDSLGHAAGDALLAAMARRLEGCLRAGDTVARLGGDEFAVLLDDLEGGAVATEVAERLIAASQQPFVLAGHEVYTAASVGVVLGPDAYRQTEEVLRDADTAMYRAKAAGKGRHAVFAPAMHAHALAILQLEHDLRRALAQEEFRLHYQPIVALATGRLRGFEALVRWQHPARGLVSPGAFIPVAEETGLIVPLGWWVLEAACRQARAWQGAYPDAPLTMSVNLSARQLTQPDLVERVARALAASGLPGARLRLELTESAIMENAVVAAGVLARLRELGVQLAVDDFGTGYSSLAYLKRFPLDTLKVDKAFVDGLGTDPNDTAIVRAIVSLAHTLGLEVTAEGVETAEQIAQLRALGCGLAQGYHFGQPLAAEAAEALLARAQPGDAPPAAAGPGPTPSTGELRLRRTARDRRLLPTAASEQR